MGLLTVLSSQPEWSKSVNWLFQLPRWHDGQEWVYQLTRTGKEAFTGRLTYTAQRRPDGIWRLEGISDYPGDRSLHEWLEIGGEPARPLGAFFERRNQRGLYRYTASYAGDGSLHLTVEDDRGQHEEHHDGRQGPVYIGNQLDFLLHGLDLTTGGPWSVQLRVENGRVYTGEIRLIGREMPLTVDGEELVATQINVRGGANRLVRALAPPLRYWFHPKDQTMLLRMDSGETTLTLIDAS